MFALERPGASGDSGVYADRIEELANITPRFPMPVPNVIVGTELQWGRRTNFSDGFSSDGLKLQFSFEYNFSAMIGS